MSSPVYEPWSHNPYCPKLPRWLHPVEAPFFAGIQICALSYGVVVALLFKCMTTLLSSVKRKQNRVQWLLAAHTTTMFISLTIYTGVCLSLGAIAYIDNREFTSQGEYLGPIGYLGTSNAKVIASVPPISMVLNGWLADGLLLRRCYIIYAMNRRAIAIPCLGYLASFGLGIMYILGLTFDNRPRVWVTSDFGVVYIMISLGLNTLLTLMIITRLALHARMIQKVLGTSTTFSGWGSVVVTILVESCAIITAASLFCAIPWIEYGGFIKSSCLVFPAAQVIAPFLIILRVANRTAFGSQGTPQSITSIRFGSQRQSAEGDGSQPDENSGVAADEQDDFPRVLGFEVENTIGVLLSGDPKER